MVEGVSPVKVAVEPVPVCVAPPGDAVTVQDPEPGRLLKSTAPVGEAHVG